MRKFLLPLVLVLSLAPAQAQTIHAPVGSITNQWAPWQNQDNATMFAAGLGIGLFTDTILQAKGVKHRWIYVILSGMIVGVLQEVIVHNNGGDAQYASVANAALGGAVAYGINFKVRF